ncbi:MAG: CtpF protein [Pseudomonadota bacterium]
MKSHQTPVAAPPEPAPAGGMRQEHPPIANPADQATTGADLRARPLPRINIQAFCEDQNTANLIQQASQDRRLSNTHVGVQMGGLKAAAHYYRNAPTPNLIMVESLHQRDGLLMDLDELASVCDSGTKVIVIGHVNDVLLYRELLMRDVSEYLVMPMTVPQLMESLSNLYNDPSASPLGNVIAFVGAKGGAGASTVCHNTAWTISQDVQSDVVIADMDLPFGTAGLDFNQDPVQGIADALHAPDRVDEVLLDRLLSRCSDHLSLFAAPGTLDRSYDLSAPACTTVVDALRKNVPYIAIDVPHLWTEWAQQILIHADRVVITAMPDLANLRNTKNLIEKLCSARPNDIPPMLVLNQVGVPKRPEISAKEFATAANAEPVAVIEFDSQLFGTAANNGQMIEEVSAKAKPVEHFKQLASALTDREAAKAESKSFLAPILDKLSLKKLGKK